MNLVYKNSGNPVAIGDVVETFRGDRVEVTYFREPTSSSSEGKVSCKNVDSDWQQEYYVGVIGAQWINREDRL
jgi:hypothetical protein